MTKRCASDHPPAYGVYAFGVPRMDAGAVSGAHQQPLHGRPLPWTVQVVDPPQLTLVRACHATLMAFAWRSVRDLLGRHRGFGGHDITFIGGLALLINNITGPAMVQVRVWEGQCEG